MYNHFRKACGFFVVIAMLSSISVYGNNLNSNLDNSSFSLTKISSKGKKKGKSTGKKLTGKNAQSVIKNIENNYNQLNSIEQRVGRLNGKVKKAKETLERARRVAIKVNELDDKVGRTHGTLSAFTHLPVIGAPVKALSFSLKQVKKKLGSTNNTIKAIEKPVISPAVSSIEGAYNITNRFDQQLISLKNSMNKMKDSYERAAQCVKDSKKKKNIKNFEKKSGALNKDLKNVANKLKGIDSKLSKIEKSLSKLDKIEGPLRKVENGMGNFEKVFSKTDKASHEIDKVLNKRFEKKILRKKISISLRDVLTGGKVGKVFRKFLDPWMDKLLKPLTQKLNQKLPDIPKIDELKKELSNSANATKTIKKEVDQLKNVGMSLDKVAKPINQHYSAVMKLSPCK